jgi:hypothetical protein
VLFISNNEKLVDEYNEVEVAITEPLLNPQVVFWVVMIEPQTPLDIGILT